MRDVFINPAGQDDNLGDSALRAGLLDALRVHGNRLHIWLPGQTSDYRAGLKLSPRDTLYSSRRAWLDAERRSRRAVRVINAGEINPQPGAQFPAAGQAIELRRVRALGGVILAMGLGVRTLTGPVAFDESLREAAIVSWRDAESRRFAGFGRVAPDWAFALGSDPDSWLRTSERPYLTVSLRFDRPLPDRAWTDAVRRLAKDTGTEVVTVAQVARDAPTAVRLADALGGTYLVAPSTQHDELDVHVRYVYGRSVAVVSDRAHALIIGATEGAYPLGTAGDPQKISRVLDAAGIGSLTGRHIDFGERVAHFASELPGLPVAVHRARRDLELLAGKAREAVAS